MPQRLIGAWGRQPGKRCMLLYLDRAERIGEFWSYPQSRAFAEFLRLRGGPDAPSVLVGMLREGDR